MRLYCENLSLSRGGGSDPSFVSSAIHSALSVTAFADSAKAWSHFVKCSHLLGFMIQDCGQFPIRSQNAQGMSTIESIVEYRRFANTR